MKKQWSILVGTALTVVMGASASSADGQAGPPRLDSAFVRFFSGEWKGEGAFSNGRPITATVVFRLSLDSAWLVCEHRDVPPNSYKATLYWGVDRQTGQFEAY
ncbi:MAG TPA: hypothetical protein VKQ52_20200, partial [Puia sp.]|nr:hypothetical protein [Puia sp.]